MCTHADKLVLLVWRAEDNLQLGLADSGAQDRCLFLPLQCPGITGVQHHLWFWEQIRGGAGAHYVCWAGLELTWHLPASVPPWVLGLNATMPGQIFKLVKQVLNWATSLVHKLYFLLKTRTTQRGKGKQTIHHSEQQKISIKGRGVSSAATPGRSQESQSARVVQAYFKPWSRGYRDTKWVTMYKAKVEDSEKQLKKFGNKHNFQKHSRWINLSAQSVKGCGAQYHSQDAVQEKWFLGSIYVYCVLQLGAHNSPFSNVMVQLRPYLL